MGKSANRAKSYVGFEKRQPVDRNKLAWLMHQLREFNRRNKLPSQHIGPLTRLTLEIAQALFRVFLKDNGRCDPAHADIARVVKCHRNSVGPALAQLEATGLMTWCRRFYRTVNDEIRRSTNGYRFRISPNAQKYGSSATAGENLPLSQEPRHPKAAEKERPPAASYANKKRDAGLDHVSAALHQSIGRFLSLKPSK